MLNDRSSKINIGQSLEYTKEDWLKFILGAGYQFTIEISCESWGYTNSYLDIADDYFTALIFGETIAEYCEYINYKLNSNSIEFIIQTNYFEELAYRLAWYCQLDEDQYTGYRYYFNLETREKVYLPELADDYMANLVIGYQELEDRQIEEIYKTHPEQRFEFWKSFLSNEIGYDMYVSHQAWILPKECDVANLLEKHGGYTDRIPNFQECEIISLGNLPSIVINKSNSAFFPESILQKMIQCAKSIFENKLYSIYHTDLEYAKEISQYIQFNSSDYDDHHTTSLNIEKVWLSEKADFLMCQDKICKYIIFYDSLKRLKRITPDILKAYSLKINKIIDNYGDSLGMASIISCDWKQLDDDRFEELCYDFISLTYNIQSIEKMGSSRSPDGGRDLVFYTQSRAGMPSEKWIVQCKFTKKGKSITRSMLPEIVDTVIQYGATGYILITNGVIDSKLIDKLDNIEKDGRLKIRTEKYSQYEIERFLSRSRNIKQRYFPE